MSIKKSEKTYQNQNKSMNNNKKKHIKTNENMKEHYQNM